jgi:hypothetical protein
LPIDHAPAVGCGRQSLGAQPFDFAGCGGVIGFANAPARNAQSLATTAKVSCCKSCRVAAAKTERQDLINTKHLLKVIAAWVTMVYVVCYGGVALIPGVRPWFMQYALHMNMSIGENAITFATFISGLVIWNVIGLIGAWVFAFLHNKIKQ